MTLFETGVRPLIDAYLARKAAEERDYGDYWSASSAGYCMRKQIFERLGVPPVHDDPRKTRVFESGHIFHEWAQRITKDADLSIAQELELQDEGLMVRGHIDDLVLVGGGTFEFGEEDPIGGQIVLPNPKKLILYDYKTKHSKWFEYAKGRPMSHYHRMQLATYMYMLRKEKVTQVLHDGTTHTYSPDTELTEARLLHISKDDLRLYEEQLLWSPELEREVAQYWSTLNGYWQAKTIPKCTCADFERNQRTGIGFMADPRYNPYYYAGEPCSMQWYEEWKTNKQEVKV